MGKFTVYHNPSGNGYLPNVQSELMQPFNTRVVIPLLSLNNSPVPAKLLNPVFEIDGAKYAMVTQYIAAVPVKELKKPAFNLQNKSDDIVSAIDFLFHGF